MKSSFFTLGKGEKILIDSSPLRLFRSYVFLCLAFFGLFILTAVLTVIILFSDVIARFSYGFVLFVHLIGAFAFCLFLLAAADDSFRKRHYWITNKRIICRRGGVLGVSANLFRLKNVGGVSVVQNGVERLLGIHRVLVYGKRTNSGLLCSLDAIPNPYGVQKTLVKLTRMKGGKRLKRKRLSGKQPAGLKSAGKKLKKRKR